MPTRSNLESEPLTTPDGDEIFVDFEESTRGLEEPFYAVYRGSDRIQRYGWLCSSCESADTAMDPMGRIECNQCGNHRKPTRRDSGYL